jgi:hypothetical protein
MSSAFLYVGIVAIWLFVLVPRWLRRHHAATQLDLELATGPPGDDDEYEVPVQANDLVDETDDRASVRSEAMAAAVGRQSAASAESSRYGGGPPRRAAAEASAVGDTPESAARGRTARRPAASPSPARKRVLAARRRILVLLLLLTATVGAFAYLKITTWWTFVPPAGMLVMYVLLLREASVADAEQARLRAAAEWRAEVAREREWAAQERAAAEEAAATEYVQYERSAQVIDISRRVSDQPYDQYAGEQLYDQYADATIRAVGD